MTGDGSIGKKNNPVEKFSIEETRKKNTWINSDKPIKEGEIPEVQQEKRVEQTSESEFLAEYRAIKATVQSHGELVGKKLKELIESYKDHKSPEIYMQKANELVQVLQTCSQESSAKRYKPTLDNFAETINKDIILIEKGNTSQEKEVIILSRQGQLSEKWKALTSEFKASSREADERLTKPYRDLISKGEIKLDPESLEYSIQLRNFMSERVGMVGQTLIDIAKKLEQGKAAGMKPEEFFATCDADFKQLHLSIISSLNTQGWLFVGTRNALARALGKVDKRLESDIAGQQQIATLLMPSRPYGACEHAFGSLIENLDKIFPRKGSFQ